MKDFIIAALPWILAGLLFAVVAASKINKVNKGRKSGTEQPQAGQESDEKRKRIIMA